jgi:tRNA nucleotidyltransferase (CCA-adding enzyme)
LPRTEFANDEGGHKGFDVTANHKLPLEKDLERRDFTINAIAKDSDGKIIDPFGGQQDLKNKIIRVVNPEAFSDDPLRMLRAVQFAARFGFNIDDQTRKMIKANAARIKEIPAERILTEFDKIVQKGNPFEGAYLLKDLGLTPQIFGKDGPLYMGPGWENVTNMAEFIWLLSHHLVSDVAQYFKTRLKGDNNTTKQLKALQQGFEAGDNMSNEIARVVAHNVYTKSNDMLGSKILPPVVQNAAKELLSGRYPKGYADMAVNGDDIMAIGIPKGEAVGNMLGFLLKEIYKNNVRNTREDLLSLAKQQSQTLKEGWDVYEKKTWDVNGEEVNIDFFIEKYDEWNTQNGEKAYKDPSHTSVLEFLQNNYEDFSTDEDLKKQLYWKLTDRELLNENNNIAYSGVVLDDESHAKLLKVFGRMIPEGWETFAHHMTIKMGPLDDDSEAKRDMVNGKEIKLTVTDYAYDNLVMAVGVEGYPTTNAKPHVTVAVNRADGGKPFYSNKLTNWEPLGFPLELTGKVTEVKR